ncbi:CRP/FNR family cyclic AMP-dependent transcriptional regulator [Marmoricola sp. OAE513]|uniref:cyclic nucleotide-binding domain-containing protein n=1 Tax=Marmoricola sp. OAE513 TaxID=2817894 RepID=UPI001AE9A602
MRNRSLISTGPAPRGDVTAEMRLLGAVPSFTDAPASLLRTLVEVGHVVKVRPGWAILAEQTTPDKAYVLLDGEVDVRRGGVDLEPCHRGEILGELGIVRRRLRSATVVTSRRSTLLHLERSAFEAVFAEDSYFRDLVGEAVVRKSA